MSANANCGRWATFLLGDETFAMRVEEVQEVLMAQAITPVPLAPLHVVGLLNLRGQVLLALDLRARMGVCSKANGKLMVVRGVDGPFACVVDEVSDVLELPDELWRKCPDTLKPEHRDLLTGICPLEGRVVLGLAASAIEEANA
jgi:purine-binding chemotaxis protein CheW